MEMLKVAAFVVVLAAMSGAAHAQLLRERTEGDHRICTYYGSDRLPDDKIVARELTIGFGENCPASIPGHDLNAPAPPNAAFIREGEQSGQRSCVYGQGGVEWAVSVPFTVRCAQTPALLSAQLTNRTARH